MKNIKLEDDEEIQSEWAHIFLYVNSCNQFELLPYSHNWDHCPLCLHDRGEDGQIKHKSVELLTN